MYVAPSKMKKAVLAVFVVFCLCVQRTHSQCQFETVEEEMYIYCGDYKTQTYNGFTATYRLDDSQGRVVFYTFECTNVCTTTDNNCTFLRDDDIVLSNLHQPQLHIEHFCFPNNETQYASNVFKAGPKESPPTFEDCPKAINVSVFKLGKSSEAVLVYSPPVCRNSRDVLGRVNCDPSSGARIDSNLTKIVCSCTHLTDQSDTCEIPVPATDWIEPNCATVTAGGFFLGFCVMLILLIVFWMGKKVVKMQRKSREYIQA